MSSEQSKFFVGFLGYQYPLSRPYTCSVERVPGNTLKKRIRIFSLEKELIEHKKLYILLNSQLLKGKEYIVLLDNKWL